MNMWIALGFLGQIVFGMRFVIQWITSERKKESHVPEIFWYFSLIGGFILLIYAIHQKDPVFIFGQAMGVFIYVRNIVLIYQKKRGLAHRSKEHFNQEIETNHVPSQGISRARV